MGLSAAFISIFFLKEPKRTINRPLKINEKLSKKEQMRTLIKPLYVIPFIVIFIATFGLASFESLLSLFVDVKFGFTAKDIAIMVMGGGLFGAIAQLFLFDRMARKIGEISIIFYCFVLSAALTFIMTFVNSYLAVVLTTFVLFVGFDLFRPAITTYLSKIAGDEQGFVGGMNSMFTSIGNIVGPILGVLYLIKILIIPIILRLLS